MTFGKSQLSALFIPVLAGAALLALVGSCAPANTLPPGLRPGPEAGRFVDLSNIKRVAVAGFTNLTEDEGAAERVEASVTGNLLKARRFALVERKQLDRVFEEQALGLGDFADPSAVEKVGKLLDAQAVLVGEVTEYYRRAEPQTYKYERGGGMMPKGMGGMTGETKREFTVYRYSAGVAFGARLIDVTSGQVIWSKDVTRSFSVRQGEHGIESDLDLLGRMLKLAADDFTRDFTSDRVD